MSHPVSTKTQKQDLHQQKIQNQLVLNEKLLACTYQNILKDSKVQFELLYQSKNIHEWSFMHCFSWIFDFHIKISWCSNQKLLRHFCFWLIDNLVRLLEKYFSLHFEKSWHEIDNSPSSNVVMYAVAILVGLKGVSTHAYVYNQVHTIT